ncbi:unnamed protein product [Adineta ricciae]|uniref:UDP-N-acetylglucosamine--peptide N-acetylglucosaminyltransferase SPINDLY n=1 Tax=Adineta ricciae TaxID=249248 RepID=A0A816A3K9_ADIRI|nr:unnamed protein product [Adineta ricciae]CAF1590642.1 unnamed protein product [Adineta ricciae]
MKGDNSRLIAVHKMPSVVTIWLHDSVDHNNKDFQYTISQLERIVSHVNTFTDNDECVEFILNSSQNKVYIILSDLVGRYLVPCIHDMPQVDSIFIFCENQRRHKTWTTISTKIKGVFIDIKSLYEAVKNIFNRYEQNAMPMSFLASERRLDQLNPSFMYTQLFKEVLLTINFGDEHIKQFIHDYPTALAINSKQSSDVDQLVNDYLANEPIWWYTRGTILHSMLNRALRVIDGEILVRMGFFITDLHRHIEQLHREQIINTSFSNIFTVYRGQGLSREDFEELSKTKGGLMSFNYFLSTSTKRDFAYHYADSNAYNPDLVGILFNIQVDPTQTSTPFAFIENVSNFSVEAEVLFTMPSVFRIHEIKPLCTDHPIYEVNILLTSDVDKELSTLTHYIRQENYLDGDGWSRLGQLLIKLSQNQKAEEIYNVLLSQTSNDNDKWLIYYQLATVQDHQGAYLKAIELCQRAVEICEKSFSPNPSHLATSYNNIGGVYEHMGEYQKALEYYEKALSVELKSLPTNHPDMATSYNNIGLVYHYMGDYPKAVLYLQSTISIWEHSLPANHPVLATSYTNIGSVYTQTGEYPKALRYFQSALSIQQQSLPVNHPDLATSFSNIGLIYKNMGDYPEALIYFEKALLIHEQAFPANHPHLATFYNNIGSVYSRTGEYQKALEHYEKALSIDQQSLPASHPHLATSYSNISLVYHHMSDYQEALKYYEKALSIRQQSLPANHPDLAALYHNIGGVYSNIRDHSKALEYYRKALSIWKQSLPANHPHLATSYINIGVVYKNMGDYTKALEYCHKFFSIRQ